MINYLFLYILLINLVLFFFNYLFMDVLILIEFFMLTMMLMYLLVGSHIHFIVYMLILSVCDGVLGLGILVLFFRYYGLDLVKWYNLIF